MKKLFLEKFGANIISGKKLSSIKGGLNDDDCPRTDCAIDCSARDDGKTGCKVINCKDTCVEP